VKLTHAVCARLGNVSKEQQMSRTAVIVLMAVLGVQGAASAYTYAVSEGGNHVFLPKGAEQPTFVFGGSFWRLFGEESTVNTIYKWDAGSGEQSTICRRPQILNYLAVTEEGLIAFIVHKGREEHSVLSVVDVWGNLLHEVKGDSWIWDCCWNPDGSSILYITGKMREAERKYDEPKVFLYRLKDAKSELLVEKGYEITWAAFDERIYLYEPQSTPCVSAFNVKTREIEPTDYRNIRFSPEGTYYFDRLFEAPGSLSIYVRETNEAVGPSVARLALERLEPIRWFDDKSLICLQQIGPRWILHPTYILNVETGQIRKGHNYILENYQPGTAVVITPEGRLAIEKVEDMDVIKPEDIPLLSGQE
jgi:hypothetical protein